MIAVLEVHDSTGWSEQTTAVPISNATAYWTSSDIRAAINGQENFVIINIANEPFGNNTTANYLPDTIAAIQALRTAGLTHNIMIDAANWGQDWSNTMRTNAMQLWNADTLRNLTFSVHMYEVYQSLAPVSTYMQGFDDMNLPLVIGEFGPINNGQFADCRLRHRAGADSWQWLHRLVLVGQRRRRHRPRHDGQLRSGAAHDLGQPHRERHQRHPFDLGAGQRVRHVDQQSHRFAHDAVIRFGGLLVADRRDGQRELDGHRRPDLDHAPRRSSGSNNGSFTVSATANTGTASRTGTVTVTGGGLTRTIAVTQAAPTANNLTLSQSSLSFASAASSSAVNVTANVSWTVTDDQTWLSASPTSGSNNGSFTVSATANTGTTSRTGTVTVTGGGLSRTVAVTQAGSDHQHAQRLGDVARVGIGAIVRHVLDHVERGLDCGRRSDLDHRHSGIGLQQRHGHGKRDREHRNHEPHAAR